MLGLGRVYAGSDVDIPVHIDMTDGTDTDPTTLVATVKNPAGTETSYTYGTDSEITKQSVGDYTLRVLANMPGRWRYRWVATGTANLAIEGWFNVQNSAFVDDAYDGRDYA